MTSEHKLWAIVVICGTVILVTLFVGITIADVSNNGEAVRATATILGR